MIHTDSIGEKVIEVTPDASGKLVAETGEKRVGRPRKRSPEAEAKILEGISSGMPIERACIRAGITGSTLDRWKADNPEFLKQCRIAEAEAEHELIRKAKDAHGVGHRWLLSCRFGYNPTTRTEHTGAGGGPIRQLTVVAQLMDKVAGSNAASA